MHDLDGSCGTNDFRKPWQPCLPNYYRVIVIGSVANFVSGVGHGRGEVSAKRLRSVESTAVHGVVINHEDPGPSAGARFQVRRDLIYYRRTKWIVEKDDQVAGRKGIGDGIMQLDLDWPASGKTPPESARILTGDSG